MDYEVEWKEWCGRSRDATSHDVPVGKDLPFVAIQGEAIEESFGPVNESRWRSTAPQISRRYWTALVSFRIRVSQAEESCLGGWTQVVSHRVTGYRSEGDACRPEFPSRWDWGLMGHRGRLRNIACGRFRRRRLRNRAT